MAMRAYWIEGAWRGRLAIIPRPRGGDWLEDEVSGWREAGIDVVVSFLAPEEVAQLGLEAEKQLCDTHGIRFISFPITDRGVPASKAKAAAFVQDLERSLAKKETVALHCRQSVGRSSLIAAYLLVRAGEDPRTAFERISSSRQGKVPDTAEQEHWVVDRDAEDRRTRGERLFETYLRLQGITEYEFEKTHQEKRATPDYSVQIDQEYLFEVKDFVPTDILDGGPYDPYSRIRQKIESARKKFREYKDWPCCLVLYNNNASLVDLEERQVMLSAMYGNYGISMEFDPALRQFDPRTRKWGFGKGGKMVRPKTSEPQNTTISALITLRYVEVGTKKLGVFLDRAEREKPDMTPAEFLKQMLSPDIDFDKHERQLGVIVWENAWARVPFARSLFCGRYDERWVRREDGNPERVFVGSEIAVLEDLERSVAPLRDAGQRLVPGESRK
jgi:protein-tyrosine phosphatase